MGHVVKHVERSIVYNLVCLLLWRCSALWVIARLWIAIVAGCSGIEWCALGTCLVGFMLSFSSVCCWPCVSPARHAAILTGPRTRVQLLRRWTLPCSYRSSLVRSLRSDTHRDAPAQQTEVHRPFSYFLQYTRTVAQYWTVQSCVGQ